MAGKDDDSGFFEDWPTWSKPTLALAAIILLGGTWIGIPLLNALKLIEPNLQTGEQVDYQPMMAVLIAMTTATIAGIFIFMTFRIDRGTRLKAESEVKRALKDEREDFERGLDAMKTEHEIVASQLRDIQLALLVETRDELRTMYDEGTKAKIVRAAVAERITAETLGPHIESALMVDVNGRLVAEYAKDRAPTLKAETAEALVKLLNGTVESLSRYAEAKREDDRERARKDLVRARKERRARIWARARSTLVGWWRG